jgi:hypothetical protein
VRQLDGFLHRPGNDLVVQRDVGDQLVVGQQGFFYQAVAGGKVGFFATRWISASCCGLLNRPALQANSTSPDSSAAMRVASDLMGV